MFAHVLPPGERRPKSRTHSALETCGTPSLEHHRPAPVPSLTREAKIGWKGFAPQSRSLVCIILMPFVERNATARLLTWFTGPESLSQSPLNPRLGTQARGGGGSHTIVGTDTPSMYNPYKSSIRANYTHTHLTHCNPA